MERLITWLDGQRGRRSELAAGLKITSGALSQWKECPPGRVLEIERLTGISRHELRPDIFGPMPAEAAE